MARVRDHMSRDLVVASPQTSLREAAARMTERGVGAVLVVEEGQLVGILSERDVLQAVAAGEEGEAPVAAWMTRHPDTIEPDDTLAHAGTLMIHGGFRHLPVLEEGRLVGIVSLRDVMRVALADQAPRGV
jgi:CBS domain-containing protein